jgi:ferrous iron transport protein A
MILDRRVGLDQLRIAETAQVQELLGPPAVRQRLGEMGLTAGSRVRLVRVAPLGDPLEIDVRGYHLCLRRSEGRCVIVDRVQPASASALTVAAPSHADTATLDSPTRKRWIRRMGLGALLLFTIKGLLWLVVPALLMNLNSCAGG